MKIVDIDKRFGDKVVLAEVNFHFSENRRYGVVGVNGAGKSSLLNILSSIDEPDGGSIEISKDKINAVANALNMQQSFAHDGGLFEYVPQLVHSQHNSQTQQLLERMVHLFSEPGAQRHYLIDLSLNELITRLLQQQSRDLLLANSDKPRLKTKISDALLYIEEHLNETLDINTLCKIACMSRSKFYQQFKLAFGTTPALWQQQLRLKKARNQSLQGHAISQVCFDVGFNSASHFSRVFKQTFGIAPKECRH